MVAADDGRVFPGDPPDAAMNEPQPESPDYLLTRSEFLFLVFTLLTAGVISDVEASRHVYGVAGYGDSLYGGGLF